MIIAACVNIVQVNNRIETAFIQLTIHGNQESIQVVTLS